MYKRFFAFLLASFLLVTVCGCGGSNTSSDAGSSEASVPAVEIKFAEKGFSIVRPEAKENYRDYCTAVFKAVRSGSNAKIESVTDAESVNVNGEILIGNTNRPESEQAYNMIWEKGSGRAKEYIICVINGNICINAVSEEMLKDAVDKFVADYCASCSVMSDLVFVSTDTGNYAECLVNGNNIGKYRLVLPKTNVSFLVMNEVEDFRNQLLEKTGYMLQTVRDDTVKKNGFEIVIGACNREGVPAVDGNDGYSVSVSGETVFINGGRNYSLAYAFEQISSSILGGNAEIANMSGSYSGALKNGYSLAWDDEFDTLDRKVWEVTTGQQNYYGNWYGMGTARSDSPENLAAANGRLYVTATKDANNFYGAYLTTKSSMNYALGYVEMSCKLADGDGIWHDLWTWSDDPEHLEFDMCECWGPGTAYASVIHEFQTVNGTRGDKSVLEKHITSEGKAVKYDDWKQYRKNPVSLSLHNDFHTYGCEWTENDVIFYFDGVQTASYNWKDTDTAYLYVQKHYLILSMLVGSNYHDYKETDKLIVDRDAAILNPLLDADYWTNGDATWEIEYVQLFQKPGQMITVK